MYLHSTILRSNSYWIVVVVVYRFLFIIWSFSVFNIQSTEIYTVRQVIGDVRVARKPVVAGQQIPVNVRIQFPTGSKLLVTSSKHGRLVIQPGPQLSASETGVTIEQYLGTTHGLGSRGSDVFGVLRFANDFTVIGNSMEVHVPTAQYPLSENQFFFLKFNVEGEPEPIYKRLHYTENSILLDHKSIFSVDGNPIVNESNVGPLVLYYMQDSSSQKFVQVSSVKGFHLNFVNDSLLRNQVGSLLELIEYEKLVGEEKSKAYRSLLLTLSGLLPSRPLQHNLQGWLEREFGIVQPSYK